jgi:hypothetical protein
MGVATSVGVFAGIGVLVPTSASAFSVAAVCITLNDRGAGLNVNGTQIIGETVIGAPRTCYGV